MYIKAGPPLARSGRVSGGAIQAMYLKKDLMKVISFFEK